MLKFRKILLAAAVFIGISGLGSMSQTAHAAGNPADFDVSPTMPANQKKGVSGYYDLLVKPNDQQTLTLKINNRSSKEATYQVSLNPAMTSDGGAIDYAIKGAKIDKTVPFDIRDYAKLSAETVTAPGNGSATVSVSLKVPNQTWAGRVLGGINIQKKGKGVKTGESGNASLNTKIAYSIALVLQNNLNKINPDLNYINTVPTKVNGYASIQMAFRNPAPTIIPDLIFTTVVKKDGQKYIENTSNRYTVAPNTKFHVNLGLDGQRVEPGKYSVHVIAKSGPFYKWEFKDKFEIKAEKADEVNKNAIFPQKEGINIWIIITIILALSLIGLLIFLLLKRKKENKEQEEK